MKHPVNVKMAYAPRHITGVHGEAPHKEVHRWMLERGYGFNPNISPFTGQPNHISRERKWNLFDWLRSRWARAVNFVGDNYRRSYNGMRRTFQQRRVAPAYSGGRK